MTAAYALLLAFKPSPFGTRHQRLGHPQWLAVAKWRRVRGEPHNTGVQDSGSRSVGGADVLLFDPDERNAIRHLIEGALLRHQARKLAAS
jgi:hypothetical protein